MEESGGKFPPLFNNSVNETKKRKERKKKKRKGKKRERKENEKEMRIRANKGKGSSVEKKERIGGTEGREGEKKTKRGFRFSLRSTKIEPSVLVEARGKFGPRNESYAGYQN